MSEDTLFPIEPGRERRAPREKDALFDALVFTCLIKPLELTVSGRGMINRALKELRDAGATPAQVIHRGQAYRERFSGTPTPGALARHWAALSTRPQAVHEKPQATPEVAPLTAEERREMGARMRAFMEHRT